MFYFEDKKEKERTQYLNGIKKYIENLEKKADVEREKYLRIFFQIKKNTEMI